MNKNILLPLFALFVLCNFSLQAQTTYSLQCQMTVEQISEAQSFDVDHPNQESVWAYSNTLITEFNEIYTKMNNGQSNQVSAHITTINETLALADTLGMDYTMFQADLDIIATLN